MDNRKMDELIYIKSLGGEILTEYDIDRKVGNLSFQNDKLGTEFIEVGGSCGCSECSKIRKLVMDWAYYKEELAKKKNKLK
jgi:hypothetical protein